MNRVWLAALFLVPSLCWSAINSTGDVEISESRVDVSDGANLTIDAETLTTSLAYVSGQSSVVVQNGGNFVVTSVMFITDGFLGAMGPSKASNVIITGENSKFTGTAAVGDLEVDYGIISLLKGGSVDGSLLTRDRGTVNIEVTRSNLVSGDLSIQGTLNLFGTDEVSDPVRVANRFFVSTSAQVNSFGGTFDFLTGEFTPTGLSIADSNVINERDFAGGLFSFYDGRLRTYFSQNSGVGSFSVSELSEDRIGDEAVVAGYSFLTDLENPEALLSFINSGSYSSDEISIWYRADSESEWEAILPEDLFVTDEEIKFVVNGFSDYAITVVPEFGHFSLLTGLLLSSLILKRRVPRRRL